MLPPRQGAAAGANGATEGASPSNASWPHSRQARRSAATGARAARPYCPTYFALAHGGHDLRNPLISSIVPEPVPDPGEGQ
jgi:hypothetical protein